MTDISESRHLAGINSKYTCIQGSCIRILAGITCWSSDVVPWTGMRLADFRVWPVHCLLNYVFPCSRTLDSRDTVRSCPFHRQGQMNESQTHPPYPRKRYFLIKVFSRMFDKDILIISRWIKKIQPNLFHFFDYYLLGLKKVIFPAMMFKKIIYKLFLNKTVDK